MLDPYINRPTYTIELGQQKIQYTAVVIKSIEYGQSRRLVNAGVDELKLDNSGDCVALDKGANLHGKRRTAARKPTTPISDKIHSGHNGKQPRQYKESDPRSSTQSNPRRLDLRPKTRQPRDGAETKGFGNKTDFPTTCTIKQESTDSHKPRRIKIKPKKSGRDPEEAEVWRRKEADCTPATDKSRNPHRDRNSDSGARDPLQKR